MSWNASERDGGIRADYAPSAASPAAGEGAGLQGALVAHVEPGSPAERAGVTAGMRVLSAEGEAMVDIIDWFWLADGFEVTLELRCPDGGARTLTLEREPMQDWGIGFADNVFDGVRTCCNACTFCFMAMLPDGMRGSLYLRDDDYRLSFLQGNFVTLTNVDDDDLERIIEMGLSPLHVSLHALDPDAREQLMGRNHARGLEVLGALIEAGLDVHAQVVLVPGVNDGAVLDELLGWAVGEEHVLSLGIVPLGFTRFQDRFDRSFNDPASARAVIEQVEAHQARSRARNGCAKVQLADEFYVNAYPGEVIGHLPPSSDYDGYPQFHDGIGMLRSLVDEWEECAPVAGAAFGGQPRPGRALIVSGTALAPILAELIAGSGLDGRADVLAVENRFFGGNVDVTGLLTAHDVAREVRRALDAYPGAYDRVVLPSAMFNDDGLTLDGMTSAEVEAEIRMPVRVVCYNAAEILAAIA